MEMMKCPNGHFYDASLNPQCPYCTPGTQGRDVGVTVPVHGRTPGPTGGDVTVAVIEKKIGIDPVVGWLVCVEGAEKGKDYRLHADNNYIGRAPAMDVCIQGDNTISRERHALVTYDFETRTFYLTPKDGRSNPRVNGKPVMTTVELSAYDRIQLGQTTLLLVPLCGERFQWQ